MIITLITDQFFQNGNGTSVSAQNLYKGLTEQGHTVRVVSVDDGSHTDYPLKERSFGAGIDKVIHSQGMQLAQPDDEIILSAIKDADIVHIYTPFKLGQRAVSLCQEHNIPYTVAFHFVPENITATIGMKNFDLVNNVMWNCWHNKIYANVSHIHCPSLMIANQLKKHKFNSKLHVISNGFSENYNYLENEKPEIFKDKFIIVATGRFSREKRFDLLIKAAKKSKHSNKILLIFGGKGPLFNKFVNMSKKLPNTPVFLGKYNQRQQLSFLSFADLYVHTADIEVEGMTCLEACACGCVPLVSDSPRSATPQFTKHEKSLFAHGNYKDLADKIDWWIEHPDELRAQKKIVASHAQNFKLENSIDAYIKMFEEAIRSFKTKDAQATCDTKFPYKKAKAVNE